MAVQGTKEQLDCDLLFVGKLFFRLLHARFRSQIPKRKHLLKRLLIRSRWNRRKAFSDSCFKVYQSERRFFSRIWHSNDWHFASCLIQPNCDVGTIYADVCKVRIQLGLPYQLPQCCTSLPIGSDRDSDGCLHDSFKSYDNSGSDGSRSSRTFQSCDFTCYRRHRHFCLLVTYRQPPRQHLLEWYLTLLKYQIYPPQFSSRQFASLDALTD